MLIIYWPSSSAVLLVSMPSSRPSAKARSRGAAASAHGDIATPLSAIAPWNRPCECKWLDTVSIVTLRWACLSSVYSDTYKVFLIRYKFLFIDANTNYFNFMFFQSTVSTYLVIFHVYGSFYSVTRLTSCFSIVIEVKHTKYCGIIAMNSTI